MTLEVGQLLDDKYEIKRLVGKGGMGNVYEGENVAIQRQVAIKVLHGKAAEDPEFVKRFEREARAAGRIGSDHIVEVLDLGNLATGERYMVMEFLHGESLADRMARQGRMSPKELFPIVVGLLNGLSDAHAAGILHRDLKPANVFLTNDREQDDFVKIVDFGVSKFMDLTGDDATTTGVTLGTPRYMAPEQAKGEKDIDVRADIYSVGVILFRALTGRPPFIADNYNELMFKVVLEDPPTVQELVPDIDPEISRIVDKAISREKGDRFQSAAELAELLGDWLERHGHVVPIRASARRQRYSVPDTDRISVPEFPTEPTSTKHAATVATGITPPPKRRWWLVPLALVVASVGAFTTVRVLGVMSDEGNATTAPSHEPKRPATITPPASSAGDEPDTKTESPPSTTASIATPEASVSASASPTASQRPAAPPTYLPPRTQPQPPPGSGPSRRYRKKL